MGLNFCWANSRPLDIHTWSAACHSKSLTPKHRFCQREIRLKCLNIWSLPLIHDKMISGCIHFTLLSYSIAELTTITCTCNMRSRVVCQIKRKSQSIISKKLHTTCTDADADGVTGQRERAKLLFACFESKKKIREEKEHKNWLYNFYYVIFVFSRPERSLSLLMCWYMLHAAAGGGPDSPSAPYSNKNVCNCWKRLAGIPAVRILEAVFVGE